MVTETENYFATGGCTCGQVRYQLKQKPLYVHCCHCRWCQRETGSSFALNAMIEADSVELLTGQVEQTTIPTNSGKGQKFSRCPNCRVTLWSNYGGAGDLFHFVRVGSLDNPDLVPPDIQIFTSSKQPWVELQQNIPAVAEFYDRKAYWPEASLARVQMVRELIKQQKS